MNVFFYGWTDLGPIDCCGLDFLGRHPFEIHCRIIVPLFLVVVISWNCCFWRFYCCWYWNRTKNLRPTLQLTRLTLLQEDHYFFMKHVILTSLRSLWWFGVLRLFRGHSWNDSGRDGGWGPKWLQLLTTTTSWNIFLVTSGWLIWRWEGGPR